MTALQLQSPYQLNPLLEPELLAMGSAQNPVIVLDKLLADCGPLLALARQQKFSDVAGYMYPGMRSPLPKDYVVSVLHAVVPMLYQLYQIPASMRLQPGDCSFSLITRAPEQLKPLQRLPHFDTTDPNVFALLHYLDDKPHGGTGFFRQRETGIDQVSEQNKAAYFSHLQQFVDQQGLEPGYLQQGNTHFELYQQLDYKANRLVVYPGNLLHSVLVQPDTDISAAIPGGRLTANIFIRFSA